MPMYQLRNNLDKKAEIGDISQPSFEAALSAFGHQLKQKLTFSGHGPSPYAIAEVGSKPAYARSHKPVYIVVG